MTQLEIRKLLDKLEKFLEKGYGLPCWDKKYSKKNRGFNFNCGVCQVWMALQILQNHLIDWED